MPPTGQPGRGPPARDPGGAEDPHEGHDLNGSAGFIVLIVVLAAAAGRLPGVLLSWRPCLPGAGSALGRGPASRLTRGHAAQTHGAAEDLICIRRRKYRDAQLGIRRLRARLSAGIRVVVRLAAPGLWPNASEQPYFYAAGPRVDALSGVTTLHEATPVPAGPLRFRLACGLAAFSMPRTHGLHPGLTGQACTKEPQRAAGDRGPGPRKGRSAHGHTAW